MALRRKSRIQKRATRAEFRGNEKKSIRLSDRYGRIVNNEENRSVGNGFVKRTLNKVTDAVRNTGGLPAKSLSANVSQAFPTVDIKYDTNGKIIPTGVLQSPASQSVENKNKLVYGSTGKPSTGLNSQNSGALEANISPATIAAATSGGGTRSTSPVSPAITPEKSVVNETFTEEDSSPAGGGGTSSIARSSAPSALSTSGTGGSIFGGNANASTGGIQLNPDGTPALGSEFDYALTPEQRAEANARRREQDYYDKESKQSLSRSSIMRDAMRAFQGEIDAVNAVYADKLKQAKLAGADRLGSDRAENFNAGAVNSSFGNASRERVLDFNRGEEGAVYNEKLQLISQINSAARAVGDKYYEQKKAAKEAGLESYLTSIKGSNEAKKAIAEDVASNIYRANLSPEKIDKKQMETIAKNAGVSVRSIEDSFREIVDKAEADAEAEKLAAEKAQREGQFTLSKDQVRYDAQGNVIGRGVSGTTLSDGSVSPAAISLAEQVNSGIITMAQVPAALRGEVSVALNKLPDPRINELDTVILTLDELKDNPKLDNILGPVDQYTGGAFGEAAAAKNLYKQIQGILALEGRQKLKGSGAISDFEVKILKDAQSALGRNLNLTEFKVQLEKVKKALNDRKAFLESTRSGFDAPSQQKTIEDYRAEFPDATEEELNALYEEEQGSSFSQVGSDTYNAESIANAIKEVESQGNYQARGGSGETGAYQFMPNTWRQWAGEFLGNPNAPQTPENQDYVAVAKITALMNQGYNPAEIALIWNGGTPKVKKGVNKYGVAYDSGAYANKVLRALG